MKKYLYNAYNEFIYKGLFYETYVKENTMNLSIKNYFLKRM